MCLRSVITRAAPQKRRFSTRAKLKAGAALGFLVTVISWFAEAAPLTPSNTYGTNYPSPYRRGTPALLTVKGTTDNEVYVLEADPTTGALPVSFSGGTVTANQGTQGVSTSPWYVNLRSAGGTELATLAAPLRVDPTGTTTQPVSGTVAATQSGAWSTGRTWTLDSGTDSVAAAQSGTWTVQPGNTANTTPWLTTINQGGNSATVSAAGALKVDGSAVTQPVSGTVTANQGGAPWTVTGTGTAGTAAAGVVTVQGIASMTPLQIADNGGSITVDGTVAATQSGAWSTGRTWTLSAGSDAVVARTNDGSGNPISSTGGRLDVGSLITDGIDTADVTSGALGTYIQGIGSTNGAEVDASGNLQVKVSALPTTADTNYGTPGASTIRAAAMLGVGSTAVSTSNPVPTSEQGHTYSDSARNDYSSVNVTTGAWVQIIASTAAAITQLYIDDTCGQVLELGTGGAGAETRKLLIPRGGFTEKVELAIPASTRVSLRAVTANCTTGDIVITGLN